MVEGLTSSATDQGSEAGIVIDPTDSDRRSLRRPAHGQCPARAGALPNVQTHEILVTLAERPHPFPSRTRKLSSPAPKILRGQPFGKIGRRQDFCVPGALRSGRLDRRSTAPESMVARTTVRRRNSRLDSARDGHRHEPRIAPGTEAVPGTLPPPPQGSCGAGDLSLSHRGGRCVAQRPSLARASLRCGHACHPARARQAATTVPREGPRDLPDAPGRAGHGWPSRRGRSV